MFLGIVIFQDVPLHTLAHRYQCFVLQNGTRPPDYGMSHPIPLYRVHLSVHLLTLWQ